MKIITVGTDNKGYYPLLLESCKKNKLNLVNLGFGKPWTGFTMKHELLKNYLETADENEIILCIDAYDVVILQPEKTILQTFLSFNTNILFADQTSLFTKLQYYHWKGRVHNAGCFIGYVKYIKQLIDIICKPEYIELFHKDDQQILNYTMNQPEYRSFYEKNTKCDRLNQLFFVTNAIHYFNYGYLTNREIEIPDGIGVLHLAGGMNGNVYLESKGFDISQVKDIDLLFKINQLKDINRVQFTCLCFFIIPSVCMLLFNMIDKIL